MSSGSVDIAGGKIIFTPNIYPTNQAKDLGFRWDKSLRAWVAPVSLDRITGLAEYFQNLSATPAVRAWASKLKDPISLSPRITQDLFPFQIDAVKFLVKNSSAGALLALAPGLGKTICAIRAAVALERKHILVVAPLSLLYNWEKEILRWDNTPRGYIHIAHGDLAGSEGAKWVIANYDTIRLKEPSGSYDQIIVDESVCIKNRSAARTKAIWEWRKETLEGSLWLLSGAPTTKFYDDLWAQLHSIDPGRFSSYWRFAERYCRIERTQWGTGITANLPDADTRLKRDLGDIYFSRTQEDVLDLPEILFERVQVPMLPEQSRIYREMESEFLAHLSELEEDVVIAPNTLARITRLLQLASNPNLVGGKDLSGKRDALFDLLSRAALPVIIWTNFILTAEGVDKELCKLKRPESKDKFRVAKLTGSTLAEDRERIVNLFQRGELDVLVAHPAVGKFGLTLTAATGAFYLERSFMGDDYYQSLHRIRRIGMAARSPLAVHLLSVTDTGEETIDHVVDRVLESRVLATRKLTAGVLLANFRGS